MSDSNSNPRHMRGAMPPSRPSRPGDLSGLPTLGDDQPPLSSYIPAAQVPPAQLPDGHDRRASKRPRRSHHVLRGVLVILAVLVAFGAAAAYMLHDRAQVAQAAAQDLVTQLSVAEDALSSRDMDALLAASKAADADASVLYSATHGRLWLLASHVPWVGDDLRVASGLADAVSDVTGEGLIPAARLLQEHPTLLTGGGGDVATATAWAEATTRLVSAVSLASDDVSALPAAHIDKVASAQSKTAAALADARLRLDAVEPVMSCLPSLLGGGGTRNYLLVAQNNAELRSTGGLPGTWVPVTVASGKVEVGEPTTILHGDTTVDVTDEEQAVIATNMGSDAAQANCTADFPRFAQMASQYWEEAGYDTPDGVIAMDPVALQAVLAVTGGVEGPDGTAVDGDTCAQVLLHDVYMTYSSGDTQDAYFSHVAHTAADHVLSSLSDTDHHALLQALSDSAASGRLLAWMAADPEEAAMSALGIAGSVSDVATPTLGVYLNDDTWSKVSWYVATDTTIGAPSANGDGTVAFPVTTTVTNTMGEGEADSLPRAVTGYNSAKRDRSDILDYVFLYAPVGGMITVDSVDGGTELGSGTLYGLDVHRLHVEERAQETSTIRYTVTMPGGTAALGLRTTPLAQPSLMTSSLAGV